MDYSEIGLGTCTGTITFTSQWTGTRTDGTCTDSRLQANTGGFRAVDIPGGNSGPSSPAEFDRLAVGSTMTFDSGWQLQFLASRRFRVTIDGESDDGDYTYVDVSGATGLFLQEYDDGDSCIGYFEFTSQRGGLASWLCVFSGKPDSTYREGWTLR